MAVAGLGHPATDASVAGGVLGDGEAEEAHHLPRGGEAAEVADLGEQPERGQRRDATEAGEPADRVAPGMARSDLLELAVDRGELRVERVEVAEHVLERGVRERVVKSLAAHPGAVLERPGLLPFTVDAPVAQQLLPGLVPGGRAGAAKVVTATHEVPQPLLFRRRRPHEPDSPAR